MADMIEKTGGVQDGHFHFNKYAIDCENGHNNGFGFRPVFTTKPYQVPLGGTVEGEMNMIVEDQQYQNGINILITRPAKKSDSRDQVYQYSICPRCGKKLWLRYQLANLKDD